MYSRAVIKYVYLVLIICWSFSSHAGHRKSKRSNGSDHVATKQTPTEKGELSDLTGEQSDAKIKPKACVGSPKGFLLTVATSVAVYFIYWLSIDSDQPYCQVCERLVDSQDMRIMKTWRRYSDYAETFPDIGKEIEGKRVVESGPGDGRFIRQFLEEIGDCSYYLGYEPEPRDLKMWEYIEANFPQVEFAVAPLQDYAEELEGTFDVFIDYVGGISYAEDLSAVLRAAMNLLKVGGRGFILTASLNQLERLNVPIPINNLTMDALLEIAFNNLGRTLRSWGVPLGSRIYRKYTHIIPTEIDQDGIELAVSKPRSIRWFFQNCIKGIRIIDTPKFKIGHLELIIFEKTEEEVEFPQLMLEEYNLSVMPFRTYHFQGEECPESLK